MKNTKLNFNMHIKEEKFTNKWNEITFWGIRASIGTIFIVHSIKKFDPSWQEWLVGIGVLLNYRYLLR